ncbi:beta-lactamase superfamily domain-containing protein [Aspergillus caelatus]|uniref:Beta-lactamase superfamily domain-containing protein n=1 Tax=Aspergillus caelatus TaxID=61420 RepID=A0A5N7A253_9EURO|nr:beta-lactamase superfamily domain-containing protein [Aspergillus caelatus]KAE8363947.1 beta-lactamase superfamily domain-containing protein [Aspergillus caelatus]
MHHLTVDLRDTEAPTRDAPGDVPSSLPPAKDSKQHPRQGGDENASVYFIGTATTIIEWEGLRVMTDPNFLHAGDHVHLGPGVSSARRTNPAVDLHELPRVDVVLLSHYHGDHFDQKVESSLRRNLPIITTPHAKSTLTSKGEDSFTEVYDLEPFQEAIIDITGNTSKKQARMRVTGMPGKHVPTGVIEKLNDLVSAIPPTNGWMVELGYSDGSSTTDLTVGYRIYISGDTLLVDDLKEIPRRYGDQKIDLMLAHLGGTTVPSPALGPLAMMVTMDAKQGVQLMQLIRPDVTIPIHYDDYEVFASSLEDFRKQVEEAGLGSGVVYLDRGEEYRFRVRA